MQSTKDGSPIGRLGKDKARIPYRNSAKGTRFTSMDRLKVRRLEDAYRKQCPRLPKLRKKSKQGPRAHKAEKIAIVPSPNAIVDPNAVMVLVLNAIIADSTVMAARRPPYVASLAVLGGYIHCSILSASGFDHGPLA